MRDRLDTPPQNGRGRRRLFEAGELRLVILALLREQPRHGYDVISEIQARAGGAYAPSPGVIYPTLTLLEDLGQIRQSGSDGAKRLYTTTLFGQAHLEKQQAAVTVALARLTALGAEHRRHDTGPVSRAMENLKAVLRQRLADEATDKPTLFAVADLIDDAARKIERL